MGKDDHIMIEEAFAQRRMSKALLTRLISYIRPYRRIFFLNLIFTLLATISQLLGPKFIQIGIDRYLSDFTNAELAMRGILIISAIYLANLFLGWFLSVAQVKSAMRVGQSAMNDMRLAVFEHIQRLSLSFFDQTHQGRIISRADTDIDSLDRILTWGANQMIASAFTFIGVVILMLQYDWRLCLAVSVVIPPLIIATHLFQKHAMIAYRKIREQASRITAALAENIHGVRVVQAFGREEVNLERFEEINAVYADRALVASRIVHTYLPFVFLVSGVATTIILGYGSSLVMNGSITVGELAAFILYLSMFFGPIQTMGDLYNSMLSTAASAERIFQLLDTKPKVVDRPAAEPLPLIEGAVEFEQVCFRYDTTPEDQLILNDISFRAEPGQTIALVGETGSGKTSIVSLIARFYEPQQGRILIDGRAVMATTVESLRSQIGIVTQENFLFTGSVMDNLKFGRTSATNDEIIAAAKTLGTHDIIMSLEEGYETKVSERGSNLSAGERQLLTFTRAMAANPRILILDEATSAVDPQTEAIIQNALEKLFDRRTSFVIAHRLSTVRHAHQIIVLSHGRIVERGTHEQLLEQNGTYARLHAEFTRSS
ncbi:MAG TPA: ABC transporter ATP-binding protein [Candidatus Kapabacteria bacterium]|nr:ABC transporter ATP-binding protein [Candidatus Kapabacteria bacterium]